MGTKQAESHVVMVSSHTNIWSRLKLRKLIDGTTIILKLAQGKTNTNTTCSGGSFDLTFGTGISSAWKTTWWHSPRWLHLPLDCSTISHLCLPKSSCSSCAISNTSSNFSSTGCYKGPCWTSTDESYGNGYPYY